MNLASQSLCEELYELSGWQQDGWFPGSLTERKDGSIFPNYHLGLLIRKLPEHISVEYQKRVDYDGEFSWNLVAQGDGFYWVEDGSIEDVTCKLAIELFKSGILTTNSNKAEEA